MWKAKKLARSLECYKSHIKRLEESLASALKGLDDAENRQGQAALRMNDDSNLGRVGYLPDVDLAKQLSACKKDLVKMKLVKSKLERSEAEIVAKVIFRKHSKLSGSRPIKNVLRIIVFYR